MRLSSTTIFDNGVNSILARQLELAKTQNQISTGRRVLTPADDPVAAAQALDLTAAKGINKQYSDNAAAVEARLALQETSLSAMTRLLQDVKTLTVQAGDGALNSSDLRSIADEIDGRYKELLGLANSTDGNGEYLFAGYRTQTLADAFDWCWQRSRSGDTILLSPACSSRDQYRDYADRAADFLRCIDKLTDGTAHQRRAVDLL